MTTIELWWGLLVVCWLASTWAVITTIRNNRRCRALTDELLGKVAFHRDQAQRAERAAVEAQQHAQRAVQARIAKLKPDEWLYVPRAEREAAERMAGRIRSRLAAEAPTERFGQLFRAHVDGMCATATVGPVRKPPSRLGQFVGLGMYVCSRPAGHLGRNHMDVRNGQLRGWWQ